jgi:hypothetical protein
MAERSARTRGGQGSPEGCIAIAGKGAPGPVALLDAMRAVAAVAGAVRIANRRFGHEWKPGAPEVRIVAPRPGDRGGVGWEVFVRAPGFVKAREVRAIAAEVGARRPLALGARLLPVPDAAPTPRPPSPSPRRAASR